MNKKIFGTIFILAGVLVLMGAGCAKKESTIPTTSGEENATGGIPATGQMDTAKEGNIGIMNDDLYVEITVQYSYQGKKDFDGWFLRGGYENYLKSKNVTQEQFSAYVNKLEGDPIHLTELNTKILDRLEELEK